MLRGLHFQKPPHAQSKLVRVISGTVLDVAVDIRRGSPTFGRHVAVELSGENHRQLFIPRGFAHGFAVLSEEALFQYKCDNYYAPQSEGAIAWNDPQIGIDWRIDPANVILSEKDSRHPRLDEAPELFDYNTDYYASADAAIPARTPAAGRNPTGKRAETEKSRRKAYGLRRKAERCGRGRRRQEPVRDIRYRFTDGTKPGIADPEAERRIRRSWTAPLTPA